MAADFKYCKNSTLSHSVSKAHQTCLVDLNDLSILEGFDEKPIFQNNEVVLNMDLVEGEVALAEARKEKNKSMDMAVVIRTQDGTRYASLLVEFKFKMTDFYGLKKVDLEEKVAGSTRILSPTPPIYGRYFLIFQSRYLQEALNRIYRMVPKLDSKYVAVDLHMLKQFHFD